jgi:hypothetical protein
MDTPCGYWYVQKSRSQPFWSAASIDIVHGRLADKNKESMQVLASAYVFVDLAAHGVQSRDRDWSQIHSVNVDQSLQWIQQGFATPKHRFLHRFIQSFSVARNGA